MTRILVVYASVEGQTRKIAEFIGDHLVRRRYERVVADASRPPRDLDPASFDGVILAAPVHGRRHHDAAAFFATEHLAALSKRPGAFVSVSMHAASADEDDQAEMRGYVDDFTSRTGWTPRAVHHAAGALRFTKYDFFKQMIARRVAEETGVEPDASGDMELTDWSALEGFVDAFLKAEVDRA